jgi:hypothetical protein
MLGRLINNESESCGIIYITVQAVVWRGERNQEKVSHDSLGVEVLSATEWKFVKEDGFLLLRINYIKSGSRSVNDSQFSSF